MINYVSNWFIHGVNCGHLASLIVAGSLLCGAIGGCEQQPSATTRPEQGFSSAAPSGMNNGNVREPAALNRVLKIAMASDLRFVAEKLRDAFQRSHPDAVLMTSFGATGALYAQLTGHAPFDLFLAADTEHPQRLVDAGLTRNSEPFPYAVGHLVVWARNDLAVDLQTLGARTFHDSSIRKIAIANPRLAPYGRAAEAALRHLAIYDAVESRLVLGDNIAQTAQFAESGAADVALISLSLAKSPQMVAKGKYWQFPDEAVPEIRQSGVILKSTVEPDLAAQFRDFVIGAEGQAILRAAGFDTPEAQ